MAGVAALLCVCTIGAGAPKYLEEKPIASPAGTFSVSLEWEDVGFIGILRIRVFRGERLTHIVELPEIDPQPGNLHWLDDEWAACESYLGPHASGFVYVHAPTGRGYLLEIRVSRPESDWEFSFASNDRISSRALDTVSLDHTSLFPILLRDVPASEVEFFSVPFCQKVSEAVDAFCEYRKKEGFREIEMLSDADIRQGLGAIVMARLDGRCEIFYFPAGAASPRDMLARTRRQVVPKQAVEILERPGAPEPVIRWTTTDGEYVVGHKASDSPKPGEATANPILARGRFEGVSDATLAPTGTQESVAESMSESPTKGRTTVTVHESSGSSRKASKHKRRR